MKQGKNHLTPEERISVLRETFEAIAAVGFMKWKAEELALGNEVIEAERPSYVKDLERIMWPDLQKMAAHTPDDRLLDARAFWIEKAKTMGVTRWMEVLSEGRGGEPFYEAVGQEIAAKDAKEIRVRYHGEEYKVVLGPPYYVEQRNGALMGSGMPTVNLADPETGDFRIGLTVEIPEAPLKPGQVLLGGKEEALRALTEAGVVRHTGEFYHSPKFGAAFPVCDLLVCSPGLQAQDALLVDRGGELEVRQRQSVLGYPLPEPAPSPPKKDRGFDRDR